MNKRLRENQVPEPLPAFGEPLMFPNFIKPQFANLQKTEDDSYSGGEGDLEEDGRQENSLGQLTKNFIRYIKTYGQKTININDLVEQLTVKKRRIYDITNVLQGIGYIEKKGKNEISWVKSDLNKKNKSKSEILARKISMMKKNKLTLEALEKENNELDQQLNRYKEEFNAISQKPDFATYGYITFSDLSKLSIKAGHDLVAVKAEKGTVVNVIDRSDAKKAYEKLKKQMESGKVPHNSVLLNTLKKEHHIFIDSPNGELCVLNVNGEDISYVHSNDNRNQVKERETVTTNDLGNLGNNKNIDGRSNFRFNTGPEENNNVSQSSSVIKINEGKDLNI